jgi:hypothetical protein
MSVWMSGGAPLHRDVPAALTCGDQPASQRGRSIAARPATPPPTAGLNTLNAAVTP